MAMDDKLYNINGYPGYKITKSGKIYSVKTNKYLKFDYSTEYPRVKLYNELTGETDNLLVHRLVAIQFIPNPRHLPCVNHKDCNKKNPSIWNLEWCTQQYNTRYAYEHGQMGVEEDNPNAKLTKPDVFNIYDLYNKNGMDFKSIAAMYNISANTVSDIIRGKRWVNAYKEHFGKETSYKKKEKEFISDNYADYLIREYWVNGKTTTELATKFSQTTIERIVFGKRKQDRFELFRKEIQKALANQQPSINVLNEGSTTIIDPSLEKRDDGIV